MSVVIPGKRPVKLRPRKPLQIDEVRKQIFDQGVDLLWEHASRCPCDEKIELQGMSVTLSGSLSVGRTVCPHCKGTGILYHSPNQIRAQLVYASQDPRSFAGYGEFATGMCRITTLPEHRTSPYDRFTMLDGVMRLREVIEVTGSVVTPRRPVTTITEEHGTPSDDTIGTIATLDLLHVTAADAAGVVVVDGEGVPVEYVKDTDFALTSEGALDFGAVAGSSPPVGGRLSVEYLAHPRWIGVESPSMQRHVHIASKGPEALQYLPVRIDCRLEFIHGVVP